MSATRRVDGPRPPETADVSLLADALSALSKASGLIERDELLSHLARSWCTLTRSRRSVVSVRCDSQSICRLATADRDGSSAIENLPVSHDSDVFDQVIHHTKVSDLGTRIEPKRVVLQPSQIPPPIGDVVLWGATPLPEELHEHVCHSSAELLVRAMANDRLLREAKLESLGEFAAGAGHEINNPIAAISGRAQLLLRDESDPQRRQHILAIGAQALRVRDMIGDTMLFARPPEPVPQQLDLSVVVERVLKRFSDEFQSAQLIVEGRRTPDVTVWADETQLSVVISELLRNSIHASPDGGRVQVDTTSQSTNDRQFALLTVRDEGPGLTDESREHLFDPFYSARQAGRGLGFGLSKCWRIVTNHGGQIDVSPASDPGFAITVHWPTSQL